MFFTFFKYSKSITHSKPGFVSFLFLSFLFICTSNQFFKSLNLQTSTSLAHPKCISTGFESGGFVEGLGDYLQRTQLAFFLAHWFDVPISVPDKKSTHGYSIAPLFGKCAKPRRDCILHEHDYDISSCALADCDCHFERVKTILKQVPSNCETIVVKGKPYLTMEYSGCLKKPLERHLGSVKKPIKEYDIIHYRMGDVANTEGSFKKFSLETLYLMIRTMCRMSDRNIIVLTEGENKIPSCGNRIILANDLPLQDNFKLFQHATNVGVGGSSFATGMMEIAKPKHVILPERAVEMYEWVDCEKWSVIGKRNTIIHFDTKEYMLSTILSGRNLNTRIFSSRKQLNPEVINASIPVRRLNMKEWFGGY